MALKLMNRKDTRAHEVQGKAQQRELHRPWRTEPTIKAECLYIVYCNFYGAASVARPCMPLPMSQPHTLYHFYIHCVNCVMSFLHV